MTQYLIAAPVKDLFTRPDQFKAIFNGKIYIGAVDQDPLNPTHQIPIFVVSEDGLRTQISQPIPINSGGYATYNGSPAKFVCDTPYSIVVLDKNNAEQWRVPDISSVDPENITSDNVQVPGRGDLTDSLTELFDFKNSELTRGGLNEVLPWTQGEPVDIGDFRDYKGTVWEPNVNSTLCGTKPDFSEFHIVSDDGLLWADNFGATYISGVDQTPAMQRMEDFGKLTNRPTHYRPEIHEMQTKLSVNRAPQMHGTGGGNGSLRTIKLISTRQLSGTIFHSKVAGDYCVEVDAGTYDFGGTMRDITLLGHLDPISPRVIGHGLRLNQFGWSAQINNISIEGFQGKNLSIGYLQDTVFNSLTLLNGSNGPQEPQLEFTNVSNFIYFNNAHIEDASYFIRCADGTLSPWEVHWNDCHFETGNYFAGKAEDAQDPSLEHRYTSSPIYAAQPIRDWSFSGCKFVPCSVQALAADSDGNITNKPHFIRFVNAAGISFDKRCRFESSVGGLDAIYLGSGGVASFGKSSINGVTVRNANPTKYGIDINHCDVADLDYHFYTGGASARCYGLTMENGSIDQVVFTSIGDTTAKTEGYLVNATQQGATKCGTLTSNLSIAPFKYVNRLCQKTSSGYQPKVVGSSISIDLEAEHPDVAIFCNSASAITINDITNPLRGQELAVVNTGSGSVTVSTTSSVKPSASNILGQDTAMKLFSASGTLYRI